MHANFPYTLGAEDREPDVLAVTLTTARSRRDAICSATPNARTTNAQSIFFPALSARAICPESSSTVVCLYGAWRGDGGTETVIDTVADAHPHTVTHITLHITLGRGELAPIK
jgi:hypothetical protein